MGMIRKTVALCVLSILFSISFPLHTNGEASMSSLTFYKTNDCLFSYAEKQQVLYYSIQEKVPLIGINRYSVYSYAHGRSSRIFTTANEILSICATENKLYYISADSYTHRGRLYCIDMGTKKQAMLLDETYGCGSILNISHDQVYVSTESGIFIMGVDGSCLRELCSKQYYVENCTSSGITYYDEQAWYFRSWEDIDCPIKVLENEKGYVGNDRVVAYSRSQYIVFNSLTGDLRFYGDDVCTLFSNVLSVMYHHDQLQILQKAEENRRFIIIDIESHVPHQMVYEIRLPINSAFYMISDKLYYVEQSSLKSIILTD